MHSALFGALDGARTPVVFGSDCHPPRGAAPSDATPCLAASDSLPGLQRASQLYCDDALFNAAFMTSLGPPPPAAGGPASDGIPELLFTPTSAVAAHTPGPRPGRYPLMDLSEPPKRAMEARAASLPMTPGSLPPPARESLAVSACDAEPSYANSPPPYLTAAREPFEKLRASQTDDAGSDGSWSHSSTLVNSTPMIAGSQMFAASGAMPAGIPAAMRRVSAAHQPQSRLLASTGPPTPPTLVPDHPVPVSRENPQRPAQRSPAARYLTVRTTNLASNAPSTASSSSAGSPNNRRSAACVSAPAQLGPRAILEAMAGPPRSATAAAGVNGRAEAPHSATTLNQDDDNRATVEFDGASNASASGRASRRPSKTGETREQRQARNRVTQKAFRERQARKNQELRAMLELYQNVDREPGINSLVIALRDAFERIQELTQNVQGLQQQMEDMQRPQSGRSDSARLPQVFAWTSESQGATPTARSSEWRLPPRPNAAAKPAVDPSSAPMLLPRQPRASSASYMGSSSTTTIDDSMRASYPHYGPSVQAAPHPQNPPRPPPHRGAPHPYMTEWHHREPLKQDSGVYAPRAPVYSGSGPSSAWTHEPLPHSSPMHPPHPSVSHAPPPHPMSYAGPPMSHEHYREHGHVPQRPSYSDDASFAQHEASFYPNTSGDGYAAVPVPAGEHRHQSLSMNRGVPGGPRPYY